MDEVIASIYDTPDKWTLNEHTFNRGRLHMWVCNGLTFLKPYRSPSVHMSWLQKWRFWRAFKWWCKNAPAKALCDNHATTA